jgi:hypothetical protein
VAFGIGRHLGILIPVEIRSKASIRFLITLVTLVSFWFIYFDFSLDTGDALMKAMSLLAGAFFVWKSIQIYSLHIRIRQGRLEIKSMKPKEYGPHSKSMIQRDDAFEVSDIEDIRVEYKKRDSAKTLGIISDVYVDKGRPVLVIVAKGETSEIYLDAFDAKEVEEFVRLNFKK